MENVDAVSLDSSMNAEATGRRSSAFYGTGDFFVVSVLGFNLEHVCADGPQVGELLKRHGQAGLPRLDPIEDMDVHDPQLPEIVARIEALEGQLQRNPVFKAEKDAAKFAPYLRRAALAARAEVIRGEMRTSQLSAFKEEAACRMAVLRRLGHIDEEGRFDGR